MTLIKRLFTRKKKTKENCEDKSKTYHLDISIYNSTYKTALIVLKLCCLRLTRNDSPLASKLWSISYWFGMFNLFYAVILEILNMVEVGKGGTFEDAVAIFTMMPCVGYVVMGQIKSYKIYLHRPVFENLIIELRSMWPEGLVTKEEHDVIIKAVKRLNLINKVYFWCDQVLLCTYIIPCLVNNIRSWLGHDVTLELPFFFWLPFDPHRRYVFDVILIIQSWEACLCVWLMLSCDFLFYIFICHLSIQFDLLSIRTRKLFYSQPVNQLISDFLPAQDCEINTANNINILSTQEEWENKYIGELKEIIQRHQTLIRLSHDVEEMFSFQLLIIFINSSIIICFCGFCCVVIEKWSDVQYKFFLTSALTQVGLFCWYGEKLIESSTGVGNALYNSGWYTLSKKVRAHVLILLHRAQKEVHITAYGFSVIGLRSYTKIIKTAWSYFTLLLNTYKDKELFL